MDFPIYISLVCLLAGVDLGDKCDTLDNSVFIGGYGVEFAQTFQMQNSVSKWAHTVVITLEDLSISYDTNILNPCPVGVFETDYIGSKDYHYSLGVIDFHKNMTIKKNRLL